MNKDKMSFGKFEEDILLCLSEQSYVNQRSLAEISGYSVGTVNKAIKKLSDEGLLDADMKLTNSAEKILKENLKGDQAQMDLIDRMLDDVSSKE